MGFELAQRVVPVYRAQHRYTGLLQDLAGESANRRFVIDNQHGAFEMPIVINNCIGLSCILHDPVHSRKQDAEDGATPGLALNLQSAVVAPNDSVDCGET